MTLRAQGSVFSLGQNEMASNAEVAGSHALLPKQRSTSIGAPTDSGISSLLKFFKSDSAKISGVGKQEVFQNLPKPEQRLAEPHDEPAIVSQGSFDVPMYSQTDKAWGARVLGRD